MGLFNRREVESIKQEEAKWNKLRIAQAYYSVNARLKPSEKYDPFIDFFKKYADTIWGNKSKRDIEIISFLEYIWMIQELDEIDKDNKEAEKEWKECLKSLKD